MTSVTDVPGYTTTVTYNAQNRVTEIADPQGNKRVFTYRLPGSLDWHYVCD